MMVRNVGIVYADAATTAKWLRGHLHYLRSRPHGPAEALTICQFFSDTCSQVAQAEVLAALVGPLARQVVIHKLLLAPDAGQAPIQDWRAWTRQAMRNEVGPSCWFAVLHQQPCPHVHVVLAGTLTELRRLRPAAGQQCGGLRLLPSLVHKEAN
jgi:hypothetical protein